MINEAMGVQQSINVDLKVGMGATMFVGSDSYPMVITQVISNKKIRVAHMNDTDYENNMHVTENDIDLLPNEHMYKYVRVNEVSTNIEPIGDIFTLRKNKRWMKEGKGLWETGAIHIGKADELATH